MNARILVIAAVIGTATSAYAQEPDRATVQLRDGSRVEGRIEVLGNDTLWLRVSMADQRKLPVSSIALIDRKGGASGLPDTELREARGADHLLLLVGGSSQKGHLMGIRGGEGSGEDNQPRTYVFRTLDGQERRYAQSEVARIYLGSYPFESTAGVATPSTPSAPGLTPAILTPGSIRVAANAGWVSTGISVKKGDRVSFSATGQVQLSDNNADRAMVAGTARFANGAPLPNVNAGALIGRIGMRGVPFGIGDQGSVPMPDDGTLFLAVNDDERTDNAGEFAVVVTPARRR